MCGSFPAKDSNLIPAKYSNLILGRGINRIMCGSFPAKYSKNVHGHSHDI